MTQADSFLNCAVHPDRSAIARCDHCGKPFCEKCRVEDVGAEETFCSRACWDAQRRTRTERGVLDESSLLEGADRPIRTGWRLWARSFSPLCFYTAPLALVMGLTAALLAAPGENGEPTLPVAAAVFLLVAFGFGIALTQVIISRQYTGRMQGNPYAWTLRRFIPWVLTLTLVLAATFVGTLALLLPGIYIALRLFWADEFALTHHVGPLQALKESWNLTKDNAGAVFTFQFLAGLAAYLVIIFGILFLAGMELVIDALGRPEYLGPLEITLILLVIFVGYGALHAPEIVRLYGMRAERARSVVAATTTLSI